jgi:hypothetical protein
VSAELKERRPLVYASRGALESARSACPGLVLENLVAASIVSGRIDWDRPRGLAFVALKGGLVAVVRRGRGRIDSERKSWEIIAVRAARDLSTKGRKHVGH